MSETSVFELHNLTDVKVPTADDIKKVKVNSLYISIPANNDFTSDIILVNVIVKTENTKDHYKYNVEFQKTPTGPDNILKEWHMKPDSGTINPQLDPQLLEILNSCSPNASSSSSSSSSSDSSSSSSQGFASNNASVVPVVLEQVQRNILIPDIYHITNFDYEANKTPLINLLRLIDDITDRRNVVNILEDFYLINAERQRKFFNILRNPVDRHEIIDIFMRKFKSGYVTAGNFIDFLDNPFYIDNPKHRHEVIDTLLNHPGNTSDEINCSAVILSRVLCIILGTKNTPQPALTSLPYSIRPPSVATSVNTKE